eukprot:SM000001S04671  [mRNA]  locus=s1:1646761:1649707:+ [translate_table: standard]
MLRAAPMAGAPGGRPAPGPAAAEVLSIAAAERSAGCRTAWTDEDLFLASCCEAAAAAESDDAVALRRRWSPPPPDVVVDAAWSKAEHGSSVGEGGSNSTWTGTSFTVDAFRFGRIPGCSAYFLTHFHSDHYGGLSRAWRHGPIYCTPPTGRLVVMCLGVDPKWIVGLEENQTAVVQGVEVTMLPANHCPGAAIILFRLPWGDHILHTGDFRACTAMRAYPHLQGVHIKLLYLDTTYCKTRYKFPPQEDVIQFAVQCTRRMLQRSKRLLVTVGAYSIGKERVYLALAQALGVKIYVDKRRERVLGALDWPELQAYLTSDASTTPLHVVPIGYLRPPRLKSYLQNHASFTAILGFRPTGWTYSEKIGAKLELIQPQRWGPVTVYGIPYSEHSSCTELKEFVQHFKPEKIIPTVNVGSPASRERMNGLFRQWQNKGLQD